MRPAEEAVVWMKLTVWAGVPVLEAVSSLLVDWGAGGVAVGEGEVSAYFPPASHKSVEEHIRRYAEDLAEPVRWVWHREVGEPWRDSWKAHFRPSRVSRRLAVCPLWEDWMPDDAGVRVIRMDPGRAFGTGTHETTRLCLRFIDEALEREAVGTMLDVGCGSGILAIGALLLGVPRVVALDLDADAVASTLENARRNHVGDRVLALRGELRGVRGVYPLVVANILYQILLGLAPSLAQRVAAGGRLVLSGLLEKEMDSAAGIYEELGFREGRRAVEGEWGALILVKWRPA